MVGPSRKDLYLWNLLVSGIGEYWLSIVESINIYLVRGKQNIGIYISLSIYLVGGSF